jgi:hypothetical protein
MGLLGGLLALWVYVLAWELIWSLFGGLDP